MFFLQPPNSSRVWRFFGVSLYSLDNFCEPSILCTFELAHVRVVSFNYRALNAWKIWCSRMLIHNELSCAPQVHRLTLVEEVNVQAGDDLVEVSVNVLQCFIVRLQRFDKVGRGIEELLRQGGRGNGLQQCPPFCQVRTIMRSAQEEDAKSGEVDGSQMYRLLVLDTPAVDEALLGNEAAERMDNEDDRSPNGIVQLPQH